MLPERREGLPLAREDEAPDTVAGDELAHRFDHGLEVSPAVVEDVALVAGLGELRPPATFVVARHVALELHFLPRTVRAHGDQARALGVHEDDQRGLRGRDGGRERAQVRRGRDDEGVRERRPHGHELAQPERCAGEERDSPGIGDAGLRDQGLALTLDPREIIAKAGEVGGLAGLPELTLEEHPHPVPLVLVGPPGVEVDADDRRGRRANLGQLAEAGRWVHGPP